MSRYKILPVPFPFNVEMQEEWEVVNEGLGLINMEPVFNRICYGKFRKKI